MNNKFNFAFFFVALLVCWLAGLAKKKQQEEFSFFLFRENTEKL